ncbi:MAG: slipin family protein [Alphaproteobacteria bacterium]
MSRSESFVDRLFKIKRAIVREHERAFLLRGGKLTEVLGPGDHSWFDPTDSIEVERHSPGLLHLRSNLAKSIITDHREILERHFVHVETGSDEIALIRDGDRLFEVLGPSSSQLYWKDGNQISTEVVSIGTELTMTDAQRKEVSVLHKRSPYSCSNLLIGNVPDNHRAVLTLDGTRHDVLSPGPYGYWDLGNSMSVTLYDMRPQLIEIGGQEILTKDRVTLRINLTLVLQIVDLGKLLEGSAKWSDHVHRLAQFALRQSCGGRTLDQLLSDKDKMDAEMTANLSPVLEELGLKLTEAGIKDVILPGEIREIMTQVVAAEKRAQANLIHRREETSATRSLLNTAKLMEDNPILLRLKELEVLETVTAQVESLNIYGGFDSVLDKLVRLRDNTPDDGS